MLLEPGARAVGFSIWSVEYIQQGGTAVLRVYIDGPDGVNIDDCAAVSWQLSGLLDVEDPLPGGYTLEVSSPGLDRPLVVPAHFQTALGRQVKLNAYTHQLGRKRFNGQLLDADDAKVVLEVDGEVYEIPYAEIQQARLVVEI
ncbi:MAG TPA: ribosome maturation factor RimP [Gammaproteobacteria bacterium]|nr:ribosome maturation factor RimP [Gammaproteobacteria bacterium]